MLAIYTGMAIYHLGDRQQNYEKRYTTALGQRCVFLNVRIKRFIFKLTLNTILQAKLI